MSRPKGLDCFVYLRKSRKDMEEERRLADEYDVLQRHRMQLLEVAKNDQHRIVEIFEEVVSGEYIMDRPEVQRMLREVEKGAVDAVLVMDHDRLGRGDMFDAGLIFRTLKYSETLVITPSEVINPNEESAELYFGVKSILAREELKAITKRMQRGKHASAREGNFVGKHPPFGYLRDDKLKLYPDPKKEWVVRMIFQRVIDGAGSMQICGELGRLGVESPKGERYWSRSAISRIIKNEVYIGKIIWGKTKYTKRNGKYVPKKVSAEQWTRHENAHEPIVPEELFQHANLVHSGRWHPPTREGKELSNPLAGILRCELCNHVMAHFNLISKGGRQPRVQCVQHSCRGKQTGSVLIAVEEAVLEGLDNIVREFIVTHRQRKKEKSSLGSLRDQFTHKEKELQELSDQMNNLHDLLERKIYTIEKFIGRQTLVSSKIKEIQSQIEQIKVAMQIEEDRERNKTQIIPRIQTVLTEYRQTEDVSKKNRLLKSVLEKVIYFKQPSKRRRGSFAIQLYLLF